MAAQSAEKARATALHHRWRRLQAWTGALLLVWVLVTFAVAWSARTLDFRFFGWPFSFWVAAQGAMLVYLALVCLYAWVARRLDATLGDAP